MSIGTPLGLTLNADGTADWGGNERVILQALIDAVEAQVTVDGISVNKNLSLGGYALLAASFVSFNATTSPDVNRSYWFDSAGDAWITDGDGNDVQVTSGGTLNVGGSSGGFYGDYVASAGVARATYTSATTTFDFRSSAGVAAVVEHGDLRLRNGSNANAVILKANASLSADYSITFPLALPSTTNLVQVGGDGTITFSNTVRGDLAKLVVTGTLEHSGSYLYTTRTRIIDSSEGIGVNATYARTSAAASGWTYSAGGIVVINIPVEVGEKIEKIDFSIHKAAATPMTCSLYRRDFGNQSSWLLAKRSESTGSGNFILALGSGLGNLTGSMPHAVLASTSSFYVEVESAAGSTDNYFGLRYYVSKIQ